MTDNPVYITHGRKYHADSECQRMLYGEYLHDFEGAGAYRREDPSPQFAAMRGKLPCLHCVPAELRVFPPLYGQTFGHEPFEYGDVLICARCFVQHQGWRETVAWPCTSAVVLGLAPRDSVACTYCADGTDPDDQGDWDQSVGRYDPRSVAPCPYCNGTRAALSPCATGECEELHLSPHPADVTESVA